MPHSNCTFVSLLLYIIIYVWCAGRDTQGKVQKIYSTDSMIHSIVLNKRQSRKCILRENGSKYDDKKNWQQLTAYVHLTLKLKCSIFEVEIPTNSWRKKTGITQLHIYKYYYMKPFIIIWIQCNPSARFVAFCLRNLYACVDYYSLVFLSFADGVRAPSIFGVFFFVLSGVCVCVL